jgi:hypothetical protein
MSVRVSPSRPNESSQFSNWIEYSFFIALNAVAVPFSAYQTFRGYQNEVVDHWVLAAAIAAISSVLFLAMNFGIRERRLKGKPHLWQVLFFLVPLGFSFFGNFNAFYHSMMKNNLYRGEVKKYENELDNTYNNTIACLNSSTGVEELETEFNTLLTNFTSQCNGTYGLSGWGPIAQREWTNLQSFIITNGGGMSTLNTRTCSNGERVARSTFQNTIITPKKAIIAPYLEYAESLYKPLKKSIIETDSLNRFSADGNILLSSIVEVNNQICSKVKSFQSNCECNFLNPSDKHDMGTIAHSLQDGFLVMPKPTATWFSVFLSLIIDLAALFYILLFVPYHRKLKAHGRIGLKRI